VIAVAGGVAVVAQSYWHARKASKQLTVDWNLPDFARFDSASLPEEHLKQVERARTVSSRGDVETALKGTRVHSAQYFAPFLAHATMEPQNATAWVKEDRCDVWAPTQGPGAARAQLADALGLSASKVSVHQTWVGGGFGRRIPQDYVVEAALVSKAIGKPVKLVWSREDDMRNSMYRPAASHFVTGALNEKGSPSAWKHTVVTQSLILQIADGFIGTQYAQMPRFLRNLTASVGKSLLVPKDQTSVEGADSLPYEIQNHQVRLAHHECGAPIGFWRSVGHSHSAFATESFIDELAHLAKADPFEFRRSLLQRKHRHRWVLELAAEKAGWPTQPPSGRARGIAVHASFGSYAAAVAEVSVHQAKIRVHKIVIAIDCGTIVNPHVVEAQMESAAIFGLTATLKGQIDYVNGAVQQSNFHDYELLRMHESPAVEVHLRPNQARPTGVGEPGVPVIAPAVANAVFALTGQRLRRLPLRLA
jgi:isoquinoline 1-oxidoreductase subunit beta